MTTPLERLQNVFLLFYAALVAAAIAVFGSRVLRARFERVTINYDGGFSAQGRRGLSILDLSRLNDVPHAHVCSGRGRCGTCRVRVESGAEQLSAASDSERATLERVAGGVRERLACQARVNGPGIAVTRVLPPYADASAARVPQEWVAP